MSFGFSLGLSIFRVALLTFWMVNEKMAEI